MAKKTKPTASEEALQKFTHAVNRVCELEHRLVDLIQDEPWWCEVRLSIANEITSALSDAVSEAMRTAVVIKTLYPEVWEEEPDCAAYPPDSVVQTWFETKLKYSARARHPWLFGDDVQLTQSKED